MSGGWPWRKQSEAIDLAEIVAEIPSRIHQVIDRHVASTPDRVALIEDGDFLDATANWIARSQILPPVLNRSASGPATA